MKNTYFRSLLATSLLAISSFTSAEIVTIKDILDREVKVDVPAKRVILSFYYPDYIAVTGSENFKNVVGISREFWEKFNPGSWSLFAEKIPNLKDIADIGNINTGTFSTEKTLALKPDVIILADWQYQTIASEIPRLEQAGIPVVVVDFNAQSVEKHTKSAKIFGKIAGTEERAENIANEYQLGIEEIQKRVKQANLAKPKIYVEFGNKGPKEHSFTFGNNMWGAIANTVGGDNISAPFIENWGPINPEQVLASKPDVIMISGTEMENKTNTEIMSMGIDIENEDAQKRLKGFTQRTGWSELPAVKTGRVYGIYHTASRSLIDLASAQFMAKSLYPTLFADIEPQKTYDDFYRKYLPVTPKGTFFIQLK
ncbi:ABC transporter substrate-binding protein [Ursidibacter arcticus]|uniref:ABC transporter substrate-binding protein n=1 Tax=Ursidibacter arcticus TaxID=1524965 RepID=UPI0012F70E08|nr:ABC transporter substrate-binding protein [Ursidibacter arcticus]KAE9532911.1 iron ABC transporter substrate-binding protein [Ursidibacter arcticus]